MTITYSAFFAPTVLGTTAATLGSAVPSSPTTTLLRGGRIRMTNTTAAAVTATLYAVPFGGTASASNAFFSGKSINANDFIDVDVPIMPAGSFIQALAGTATAITAHMISGGYYS
jgi:hypothetical protein